MHEYDVALKNILTRPAGSALAQLTGASSLKWIDVEAPKVINRRVDLLGELPDGNLVHIELQSRNEKDFPLRMAEYLFGIGRQYGRLPRQVVLYVGEAPLRMKDHVESPDADPEAFWPNSAHFVRFPSSQSNPLTRNSIILEIYTNVYTFVNYRGMVPYAWKAVSEPSRQSGSAGGPLQGHSCLQNWYSGISGKQRAAYGSSFFTGEGSAYPSICHAHG